CRCLAASRVHQKRRRRARMTDRDFAAVIEPVARALLGAPNRELSSKKELRYGSRGSLCIDLKKGTWYDHEQGYGGGTIDLVVYAQQLHGHDARSRAHDWLRDKGYIANGAAGRAHSKIVATYNYDDEAGVLLSQAVRYDPKGFAQRAPNGQGGWIW